MNLIFNKEEDKMKYEESIFSLIPYCHVKLINLSFFSVLVLILIT